MEIIWLLTGGAAYIALGASLQQGVCFGTLAGLTHPDGKHGLLELSSNFAAPS